MLFTSLGVRNCLRMLVAIAIALSLVVTANAAGVFATTEFTGDSDCGVASSIQYTHAVNIGGSGIRVNGVDFIGTSGANPSGSNFSTSGFANQYGTAWGAPVTGAIQTVCNYFNYNGTVQTLTLTGLTAGQDYKTTFYNCGWGGVGGRYCFIWSDENNDGVEEAYIDFDENYAAASLLTYAFTAESDTVKFTIEPYNTANTFHLYGFSNELVDNRELLFLEKFWAWDAPDRTDINYRYDYTDPYRQEGSLGFTTWSTKPDTDAQLGNICLADRDVAMLSFGSAISLDANLNGTTSANGLDVEFEMAADALGAGGDAVTAGVAFGLSEADRFAAPGEASSGLSVLFGGAGAFEVFDGTTSIGTGDAWDSNAGEEHDVKFTFTDTDGNPFDGSGDTVIEMLVDGASVFSYTKAGGYADNYMNFYGERVASFDSLYIYTHDAVVTVPEPATLALLLCGALGLGLFRRKRLFAVALVACIAAAGTTYAGTFSEGFYTGDGDVDISSSKYYVFATNLNDTRTVDVNGVLFDGAGFGGNPSSPTFEFFGHTGTYSGNPLNAVTGGMHTLNENFIYSGGVTDPKGITLMQLVPDNDYVVTFWNTAWGEWSGELTGVRWATVTSSLGDSYRYNENVGAGVGTYLRYEFTATEETATIYFEQDSLGDSIHLYAVTNESLSPLVFDYYVDDGFGSAATTTDINTLVAARQSGILAGLTYSTTTGTSTTLEMPGLGQQAAFARSGVVFQGAISPDVNFDTLGGGGMMISFDVSPDIIGLLVGDTPYVEFNFGLSEANRFAMAADAVSHFGIRLGADGTIAAYDDGTEVVEPTELFVADGSIQNHSFELRFVDPTDDDPFDGVGQTDMELLYNGISVATYRKGDGGLSDNYLNWNSNYFAALDNFFVGPFDGEIVIEEPGIPGDLNGDGLVGSADLDIVRANWGQEVEVGCLLCGDPSQDGVVGSADLDIVRANWGARAPAAVPEPGTWMLLAAAGLSLLLGRRR